MSRYDDLTKQERRILELVDARRRTDGVDSWLFTPSKTGAILLALSGESSPLDVVASEATFLGLEKKGYIACSYGRLGGLQFTLQQRGTDYAEYASLPRSRKIFLDVAYSLAYERSIWAKLFWLFIAFAFGSVAGLLLHLAGWI